MVSTAHLRSTFAAGAVALFSVAAAPSAFAQQTIIRNGQVTVHNSNGTTTHIKNGVVTTTGRVHRPRHVVVHPVRVVHPVQVVRPIQVVRPVRVVRPVVVTGNFGLAENGRRMTVNGRNGTVSVSGNSNNVTVTGTVRRLVITGNNNFVLAQRVGVIETPGNHNTVVWRRASGGASPGITNMGASNAITHKR